MRVHRYGKRIFRFRLARPLNGLVFLLPCLPALHLLAFMIAASGGRPAQAGCGTGELLRNRQHTGSGSAGQGQPGASDQYGNAAGMRRAAYIPPAYRTLETEHLLLRYSLRGIHGIKRVAADSALTRARDGLYASLAAVPDGKARDSAVIAGLDRIGAPHPAFAKAMADYFEQAHAEYIGRLGMKPPQSFGASHYYRAPMNRPGKYAVDIVDVYPAARESDPWESVSPQTYGLTFRPAYGGMLMENDFIYNAKADPTGGEATGDSLKSCLLRTCDKGGSLNHNYAAEWEAGLKVTCFHEYYHAVQFAYTPEPRGYHVWYETGATAMEERNAPEIDDYSQYLQSYFDHLPRTGMFDFADIDDWEPQYGNAVFHLYLAEALGEGFDVGIWEQLERNGNDLRDALAAAFAAKGLTSAQVYGGFAGQLAFSGTASRPDFPLFSVDMPRWPRLVRENLDLQSAPSIHTGNMPPFTLRAFSVTGIAGAYSGSAGGKALFPHDRDLIPVLAARTDDSGKLAFPLGSAIALEWPGLAKAGGSGGTERILLLANASMRKTSAAEIRAHASVPADALFAYPNPLKRLSEADRMLFSRLPGSESVRIVAENGTLIRELDFQADSLLWSWDLRDQKKKPVLPGLYYYGTKSGGLAPLVIY